MHESVDSGKISRVLKIKLMLSWRISASRCDFLLHFCQLLQLVLQLLPRSLLFLQFVLEFA